MVWLRAPGSWRKRVVRCLRGACAAGPGFLVCGARGRDDPCRWARRSGAIERLVPVSCAGCPASTSGLSTWWSTTALGETWF
jgi:hypothetical protein